LRGDLGLEEVVEISRSVHDPMNLDYLGLPLRGSCGGPLAADDVENEVGVDYQNSVAVLSQLIMARSPTKERLRLEMDNSLVEPIHE
jgi:hypothetical protein